MNRKTVVGMSEGWWAKAEFEEKKKSQQGAPGPDMADREAAHHEKVMRAGFSTIGSKRWLAVTVAMGRMATKSLMRHE